MKTQWLWLGTALLAGCATAQPTPTRQLPSTSPIPFSQSIEALAADTAVRQRELAKISGLVGTWTGPGWRILPSGVRVEYDQTVVVTSKMIGQALMIEGSSIRRPPTGPPGTGSMAVVTWEPDQNRYAFRSFTGGRLTDADGQLIAPDTFQWIVKGPPLGLRFTVKFSGDKWSEVGEVSRDGENTWVVSYRLEMQRNKAP